MTQFTSGSRVITPLKQIGTIKSTCPITQRYYQVEFDGGRVHELPREILSPLEQP